MEELFALQMCWGIRVERELRVSAREILLFSPLIPGWSPVGARPPGDGMPAPGPAQLQIVSFEGG